MQFTFYQDVDAATKTGTATGYAQDVLTGVPGFYVEFDEDQAKYGFVDFTIGELRQMLAEAEELRDNRNRDWDYAPLAGPDEDVPLADEASDTSIAYLLNRAETAVGLGEPEKARVYLDIAYARKDLLR